MVDEAMPAAPVLELPASADAATAVALVLPGGRAGSYGSVKSSQLAVRRMQPFARAIAGRSSRVAVARLRYRYRGWNEPHAHPVGDVDHALGVIAEQLGPLPVVLVGHSLGGRAALCAAGAEHVRGVVALAPWLPDGEPIAQLAGRDLVVLHGTRDLTTSPGASARFAARAQSVADRVVCLRVPRSGHGMLVRAPLWHRLTAEFVAVLADGESLDVAMVHAIAAGCHSCPPGDASL